MGHFRELLVYKKGYALAMEIFQISKSFPVEEKYSLTDQIRRSSRSVTTCIAEAYRKRRYVAHFVSKISDSDMENAETEGWLDYALGCNYISGVVYTDLNLKTKEVGKLLNDMINNPEKYL